MLKNQIWIKPRIIYEKVYQELIGDDPKTIGYCDDETKHLYIKLGLDEITEQDCTLHEILHAICYRYKIKISHSELDKLSTALIKVARLNDWIK